MHNPKKSPFDEHAKDVLLGAVLAMFFGSAVTCVIIGAVLGARAGHYEGLGLSLTVIKGVLIGGSIGVIATRFAPTLISVIIGSAGGVLSDFWFDR